MKPIDPSVVHSVLEGSAVLFVGAGLSFLSKNMEGNTLPNGEQLKIQLHEACGIPAKHSLDKISQFYVRKYGPAKLYEFLSLALGVKYTDRRLTEFYKLPWRRIYTTNYDNVIEEARQSTRGRSSFTLDQSPSEGVADGAIVHINGSMDAVSPQSIATDLKLTDYSYATSRLEADNEWVRLFLNDLRFSRAIIFVGYSLADLDITRLLVTAGLKSKTVFFIAPDADEVELTSLEPFGEVYATGIHVLFEELRAARHDFDRSALKPVYYSITDLSSLSTAPRQASIKVHEQLVYGALSFPEVISDVEAISGTPYNVPRTQLLPISTQLVKGELRDVAVVGELACGKTFGALQLARALISSGYKVFWVQDGRRLGQDLDLLAKDPSKLCLIVDGYAKHVDALRDYLRQRPKTHQIVLTERSATHEFFWPLIREHLLSSLVPEVVLDNLDSSEVSFFEELVNFGGLWIEKVAGRPAKQRRDYIMVDLERSLYRLLLEVLRSKKVQDEIERLLTPIHDDADARRFFTTAFIVGVLGYNFWINDWQSFYGIRNVRDVLRKHSEYIRHFVIVDAAAIRPRSSVASFFMLRNYIDDSVICECVIDIYRAACANQRNDDEFRSMMFALMRYNVVEPLFSDHNKLNMLVNYYHSIRSIGDTRNNADYWLQFGIACTIASDFEGAETAFKNAYSRESKKQRPNLTRIDNYYARYQLEKSSTIDDPLEAFVLFRSGLNLLLKQIFKDDNRHYPFKAGRALAGIAAKHYDAWSDKEQQSFSGGCNTLLTKAKEWESRNRSGQEDVAALIRAATEILRRIEP